MHTELSDVKIASLLPQIPPFLFVDKIKDFNYESYACKTSFLITENCLLVEEGYLSEAGILENIAQTCAIQIGFVNKYILKKEICIGFIGAVQNMKIDSLATVGEILETTMEIMTEFADMKIAHCKVSVGNKKIAEGELKIAIQPNRKI